MGTCSQQLASPPVPRAFSLVCGTIKGLICTPKPPREALGGRRGGQEKCSNLESGCCVALPVQRWGTRTLLLLQEDFGVTTRPCSPLAGPQQVNASPPWGQCPFISQVFSPAVTSWICSLRMPLPRAPRCCCPVLTPSAAQVHEAPKAVKLSEFGVSKHQGPFLLPPTAAQRQGGKRRLGTWGSLLQRGAFTQ